MRVLPAHSSRLRLAHLVTETLPSLLHNALFVVTVLVCHGLTQTARYWGRVTRGNAETDEK